MGLVSVPLPSFPGVFLEEVEEEGENSWRRAEPGETSCSRRKVAMGDASPSEHARLHS